MKEPVKEERSQAHSDPIVLSRVGDPDPIVSVKLGLKFAVTNQERIDVLARAKVHADRQWLYWRGVARWIDGQMKTIELEAQLRLPLIDPL
ncbi:MAG: hypothetical protein KAJ19_17315 [Gammaproteobacteria bacterium]|nr:hypothetical protein [Gammaproteobacteria bacterium]